MANQPAARGWVLDTNSSRDAATAPAYVGNGYVGTRISAAGAGFVDAPVATETHIAGVYADVTDLNHGTLQPQGAVNVPGWTALDFSDGTATYGLSTGTLLSCHQALDLHAGTVTTSVTWASPSGRVTDLRYVVVLDRARARIGAVDLRIRPHWSGTAQITDVLGECFDYHPPWISAGLDPDAQSASPPGRTTPPARKALSRRGCRWCHPRTTRDPGSTRWGWARRSGRSWCGWRIPRGSSRTRWPGEVQ